MEDRYHKSNHLYLGFGSPSRTKLIVLSVKSFCKGVIYEKSSSPAKDGGDTSSLGATLLLTLRYAG